MSTTTAPSTGRRLAILASAVALAVGVAAGGAGASETKTKSTKAKTPKGPKVTVEVGDNFYDPEELEVPAGTKVVFKNEGKILHNVLPSKGDKWGTKALTKGKKYSYRFKKPGEYAYYCSFHGSPTAGQRGVIVVTEPIPVTTTTVPTTMPAG